MRTAAVMVLWSLVTVGAPSRAAEPQLPSELGRVEFNDVDNTLLRATLFDALSFERDGMSRYWKNPKTGNRGRIKMINTVGREPATCRVVRVTNIAGRPGVKSSDALTFCKNEQGGWSLQVPYSGSSPKTP